jgi:uncharacterized protein YggE
MTMRLLACLVLATGLGLGFMSPTPPAAAAEAVKPSTLQVEAEGQVVTKPDKAEMVFSVVTEGARAQEAAQANAVEAEKFLAAVKKALGPEEKVQTLDYRVYPLFKVKEQMRGKEKVRTDEIGGYRAVHLFEVELKDLRKIGAVSDTALKNGASQAQGPYFSHSQGEALQRQAAVKALERARKLADALAEASGLKVSRVLKIKTTHGLRRSYIKAKAEAPKGEVETQIEPTDITFESTLEVTFELAP